MSYDEVLQAQYPPIGPCLICGVVGADQRHRVLDSLGEMYMAGDSAESLARDFGVSVEVVLAAVEYVKANRID